MPTLRILHQLDKQVRFAGAGDDPKWSSRKRFGVYTGSSTARDNQSPVNLPVIGRDKFNFSCKSFRDGRHAGDAVIFSLASAAILQADLRNFAHLNTMLLEQPLIYAPAPHEKLSCAREAPLLAALLFRFIIRRAIFILFIAYRIFCARH